MQAAAKHAIRPEFFLFAAWVAASALGCSGSGSNPAASSGGALSPAGGSGEGGGSAITDKGGTAAVGGTSTGSSLQPAGGRSTSGGTSAASSGGRSTSGGTSSLGGTIGTSGGTGTGGATGTSRGASILEPATGALLGLYHGDVSISATATKLGRTVPLHLTYYAFSDDWTTDNTAEDLRTGRVPFVNWELFGATLDDIAKGTYDTLLNQRATAAKKLGKPFFIDFGAEMNRALRSSSPDTRVSGNNVPSPPKSTRPS